MLADRLRRPRGPLLQHQRSADSPGLDPWQVICRAIGFPIDIWVLFSSNSNKTEQGEALLFGAQPLPVSAPQPHVSRGEGFTGMTAASLEAHFSPRLLLISVPEETHCSLLLQTPLFHLPSLHGTHGASRSARCTLMHCINSSCLDLGAMLAVKSAQR